MRQDPDGYLYVLTDERNGKILRVSLTGFDAVALRQVALRQRQEPAAPVRLRPFPATSNDRPTGPSQAGGAGLKLAQLVAGAGGTEFTALARPRMSSISRWTSVCRDHRAHHVCRAGDHKG